MNEPIIDEKVETLMAEFARSGVRELHLRHGDFEIYLSNDASAPIVSRSVADASPSAVRSVEALPAPPVAALTTDLPADAFVVSAPNLGTFYRSPKPGAVFYVELGSQIAVGDELCLIEVMKLFTAVRAEVAGRIHSIFAPDGEMVEAGQPLFAIVRD